MMLFNSSMKPEALVQNEGKPFSFTCDLCGETDNGYVVKPGRNRESWAVLPDDWSEIEDRRDDAKKKFVVCCSTGDCQHEALKYSG
jgi:hypothetical protein